MTFDQQIFTWTLRAKCVSACRADQLILKEKAGEDIKCCELKLILLVKYIEMLENYYCKNFGDGGNITPDYECLTTDQAQLLLSKLKVLMK